MADILIRMEMPDGCHHCRFSYLDKGETNGGEPCTVIMCSAMEQGTNGAEYDENRPSWCPLIPLPEGHGKLIDAERFRVILCRLKERQNDDVAIHALNWAIECLDKLDTIVPAEGGGEDGWTPEEEEE